MLFEIIDLYVIYVMSRGVRSIYIISTFGRKLEKFDGGDYLEETFDCPNINDEYEVGLIFLKGEVQWHSEHTSANDKCA